MLPFFPLPAAVAVFVDSRGSGPAGFGFFTPSRTNAEPKDARLPEDEEGGDGFFVSSRCGGLLSPTPLLPAGWKRIAIRSSAVFAAWSSNRARTRLENRSIVQRLCT